MASRRSSYSSIHWHVGRPWSLGARAPRCWWWFALLGSVVAVALALTARWSWGAHGEGPAFRPQPDALEYAASAQALIQTGRFFLQVGPLEEPPHYSPGWPAILAAVLWFGTPPQRLWLWPGLCGGLLCLVLACGTALLVIKAAPLPRTTAQWWAALLAGLAASCAWAVATPAVEAGSALLSDEPTALFAVATLLLVFLGLELEKPGPWLAAAGLVAGLATAMRRAEGALLVVPTLALVIGGGRQLGEYRRLRACRALALGALLPCMLVGLLLVHSRRPAWQWTNYGFWSPSGTITLEPRLAQFISQARPLFGLSGPGPDWSLGGLWSLLGLYAVALPRRAWIAGIALLAMLVSLGCAFVRFRATLAPGPPPERIFRHFRGWMDFSDDERARQPVPFDPLLAQAVGLLDPETLREIHGWGTLPPTLHVRRLRRKGLLP